MSEPPGMPQRLTVNATPEVEAGVYADFVGVWHQPHCFVLDFSVHTNPPQVVDVEGQRVLNVPARMVARVRVPPGQVFEIMKALEQQLTRWEHEQGGQTRGTPPATNS